MTSQNPVEEIKERLNIVEVVQEYIPLKKAGTNYKAPCPFHNEKTPSFTVSETKQFFHCFGCAKGGDVFTFIQEIEGVEFAESLRILAQKANVELRPTNPREHNERTKLLDCLKLAAEFFHRAYMDSQQAQKARDYTVKRGLQAETIDTFQIGYSPEAWDSLITFLKKNGFTDAEIEKSGLSIRSPKTQGWYDRFRDRLMFPIYNTHGNVIGFGGRTLDPNQKEAKYINSPQTAVYNKSATVYGLHLAKKFIQRMDAVVLVEGYMDVVAAHQAKFRNVVAASGTALTIEQIQLLKRFTHNIILAFDADSAGLNAAWRGMQIAIQQGMNIKVLHLPDGKDPDELIAQDPQLFRQQAMEAKPFMEYAFDSIIKPLDLSQVADKKKAVTELLPMIALFPDTVEQTHYLQLLAGLIGVESDILQEKLTQQAKKGSRGGTSNGAYNQQNTSAQVPAEPQGRPLSAPKSRAERLSEQLFAYITLHPEEFSVLKEVVDQKLIIGDELLQLYNSLETYYNPSSILDLAQIHISDAALRSRWEAILLLGEELYAQSRSPQDNNKELQTLVESLKRYRIKIRLKEVEQEIAQAEYTNNREAIERLSQEFRHLTESLRNLA